MLQTLSQKYIQKTFKIVLYAGNLGCAGCRILCIPYSYLKRLK